MIISDIYHQCKCRIWTYIIIMYYIILITEYKYVCGFPFFQLCYAYLYTNLNKIVNKRVSNILIHK